MEAAAEPVVTAPVIDEEAAPVKKLEQNKVLEQPVPAKRLEESTVLGEGMASFYGTELAGNRTASGERFNPNAMTAAHRTLPMGTKLRVTNKANGKSVIVRINDRGPFAKGRIIDVSRGAAEKISMIRSGTARVLLQRLR
ncbi:MAG TPA: septal ring lytic transglycosylase RlpA family protein [Allosphingosinicella sp.]